MQQLVKGGKKTFGWSRVSETGRIIIPPDAADEYSLSMESYAYLLPGSRKSGGFGLSTLKLLENSRFAEVLSDHPELLHPESISGAGMKCYSGIFCVVPILNMSITIPLDVLNLFGIKKESMLLTVRGSRVALGFIVRGPIIEEAKRHPGLETYA